MKEFRYGYETVTAGLAFQEVVQRVSDALKAEGFGVLTRIDVKSTLKEKLGLDFRPYVILGACNPVLASRALERERQIGLLLPCNVVVQEEGGSEISVSIADPNAMFTLVDNPEIAAVAKEADERLRRVIASLAGPPNPG